MKTLLAAVLVAFAVMMPPAAAAPDPVFPFEKHLCGDPCVVKKNNGGSILLFIVSHDMLVAERRMVVLDGDCYSACTLMIDMLVARGLACITPRAEFYIHQASSVFRSGFNGDLTFYMSIPYSPKLQAMIDASGGAPRGNTFLRIGNADLARIVPRCPDKVPSSPVP